MTQSESLTAMVEDDDAKLAALFSNAKFSVGPDDNFVATVMQRVETETTMISAWTTAVWAAIAVFGVFTMAPFAPQVIGEIVSAFASVAPSLPVNAGTLTLILTVLGVGGTLAVLERS
jgi:hypothetical protein